MDLSRKDFKNTIFWLYFFLLQSVYFISTFFVPQSSHVLRYVMIFLQLIRIVIVCFHVFIFYFSQSNQVFGDCQIKSRTFSDGESFNLSCRERCLCHGSQYGCINTCPEEDIIPSKACKQPRLIKIPGQCCRQWLCTGNVNQGDKTKPGRPIRLFSIF